MQAAGETSGLVSEPEEGVGLSDETEALMWAEAHGQGVGLGETLVELQADFNELGIR